METVIKTLGIPPFTPTEHEQLVRYIAKYGDCEVKDGEVIDMPPDAMAYDYSKRLIGIIAMYWEMRRAETVASTYWEMYRDYYLYHD